MLRCNLNLDFVNMMVRYVNYDGSVRSLETQRSGVSPGKSEHEKSHETQNAMQEFTMAHVHEAPLMLLLGGKRERAAPSLAFFMFIIHDLR